MDIYTRLLDVFKGEHCKLKSIPVLIWFVLKAPNTAPSRLALGFASASDYCSYLLHRISRYDTKTVAHWESPLR
jgi:hypothetical protein